MIRQMNSDYSICQALSRNAEGVDNARVLYDIFCQWHIHFPDRVAKSDYLVLPPGMKVGGGVGLWHLNGHDPKCYPRFSPHFMLGIGNIEGEMMETLWAPLNKTSGSTRHMTPAHRHEVLDKQMNDSNWTKLVGIVPLLSRRYKATLKGFADADLAFSELDSKIVTPNKEVWKRAEQRAMTERGEALDIYHVRLDKGQPISSSFDEMLTFPRLRSTHKSGDSAAP